MKVRSPLLLASLASLVLGAACAASRAPEPATARVGGDVLATVNGVAVTRDDVQGAAPAPSPHGGAAAPAQPRDALDRVIQEELLAQRAVSLGLDRDPTFREELRLAEARLRAWKRARLATLAEQRGANAPATVSDADARAWYEANAARMRTELRVARLLVRDEATAAQVLRELQGGGDFDAIARRQYPSLPEADERPWVIDRIGWHQMPAPWRDVVYALGVGATSGVIRGANNRFWIVRVLERRERPENTFEVMRPHIVQALQEERAGAARDRMRDELRRGARVVVAPR